jgi:hypothetical protein
LRLEVVGEGEGLDELLETHQRARIPVTVDALDLGGEGGQQLGNLGQAGVDLGLDIGGERALDLAYPGQV